MTDLLSMYNAPALKFKKASKTKVKLQQQREEQILLLKASEASQAHSKKLPAFNNNNNGGGHSRNSSSNVTSPVAQKKKLTISVGGSSSSSSSRNDSYFPPLSPTRKDVSSTLLKAKNSQVEVNVSVRLSSPFPVHQPILNSPNAQSANALLSMRGTGPVRFMFNGTPHSTSLIHSASSPILPSQLKPTPAHVLALAKFKCTNPLCVHLTRQGSTALGSKHAEKECIHQRAARLAAEEGRMNANRVSADTLSEHLNQGLDILQQLEKRYQEKQKQKRQKSPTTLAALPNRTSPQANRRSLSGDGSSSILPPLKETLIKLLTPPSIDYHVVANVIDLFHFDHEYDTLEAKRARQIRVWQEKSAKVFSVCEAPFLHIPNTPIPGMQHTPIELQALTKTARPRDCGILGLIFAFLPTRDLYRTAVRISHLARLAVAHPNCWSGRSYTIGDRTNTIEVVTNATAHESLHHSKSLVSSIKRLPKFIRERIEHLRATSFACQSTSSDMSEFRLDTCLLFPNLSRLRLELGVVNGGSTVRQINSNSNRCIEDVMTAKQLKYIRHFHLDSNLPGATQLSTMSATSIVSPLTIVPSESRGAQWLRLIIPAWELNRRGEQFSTDLEPAVPTQQQQQPQQQSAKPAPVADTPTVHLMPSIEARPTSFGMLTIDLQNVLFTGMWILKLLEKSKCNALESLSLSISFQASSGADKNSAASGSEGSANNSSNAVVASGGAGTGSKARDASTLGQQRLTDLFADMKVFPLLFRSFATTLKSLTLNLENDKVLAREKMTESTAFLIFMPLLQNLQSLSVKNLKLVLDGGSVIPFSHANHAFQYLTKNMSIAIGRTPPILASLFHLPSWKHYNRALRSDPHRSTSLDVENAWGDKAARDEKGKFRSGAWKKEDEWSETEEGEEEKSNAPRRRSQRGTFNDDQYDENGKLKTSDEILGDLASKAALSVMREKQDVIDAEAIRRKKMIDKEAGVVSTPSAEPAKSAEFDPNSPMIERNLPLVSQTDSVVASDLAFTTLCLNDYKVCKCLSCQAKLHNSLSTFEFMMSHLSKLVRLKHICLDDLSIGDFATIVTTTTTTVTKKKVNRDTLNSLSTVTSPVNNGSKKFFSSQEKREHVLAKQLQAAYRKQVEAEFTVLTTSSTITFSNCAPFLLLERLQSLTLPISCYEYDPATNLVDAVCMLLGSRLKELTIVIYGNGWIPQSLPDGSVIRSNTEDLYKPMPLVLNSKSTDSVDQPTVLPYPCLHNLNQLTGLQKFSLRRDTHSLGSLDPVLPVLPLIESLSVRSSPLLEEVTLDGFALNQDDLWRTIAFNLGGEIPQSKAEDAHEGDQREKEEADAGTGSTLHAPQSSAPSSTVSLASTPITSPKHSRNPSTSTQPEKRSTKKAKKSREELWKSKTYLPGLRSLTLHNFYGSLTGAHLIHLRSLPHLQHLSIGNYRMNDQLNMQSDLAFQSFNAMLSEIQSGSKVVTSAVSVTQPLSTSLLTILSELTPQLTYLELIGQENLTNSVFQYWAETEVIPHEPISIPEPKQDSVVETASEKAPHAVADTDQSKDGTEAKDQISASASLSIVVVNEPPPDSDAAGTSPTDTEVSVASTTGSSISAKDKSSGTGRKSKGSRSKGSNASVSSPTSPESAMPPFPDTNLPPFPYLTRLRLVDCRPLGYTGLEELLTTKLSQLEWVGSEPERRNMAMIQQVKPRSVQLQFRKAGVHPPFSS